MHQTKLEVDRREAKKAKQSTSAAGTVGSGKVLTKAALKLHSPPPAGSGMSGSPSTAAVVAAGSSAAAAAAGTSGTIAAAGTSAGKEPEQQQQHQFKVPDSDRVKRPRNLGHPGRRSGPPTFAHELASRGGYASAAGADNSAAVKERIMWMSDGWRKAIFEVCEYGSEEIPEELITDVGKASRTQQTHDDDGTTSYMCKRRKQGMPTGWILQSLRSLRRISIRHTP